MFREESGKVSFGRVFSALVLLYYFITSGYIVYETKVLPDIPANLYWVLLSLYGVNKFANALENFKK